jgi:kynurenine 3-monooxygenase
MQKFGVWDDVKAASITVPGRKDWTPQAKEGAVRMLTNRKFTTHVLPRDKLVSVLHKHIVDNYSDQIELNYGYQVEPVDFSSGSDGTVVIVKTSNCQGETIDDLEREIDDSFSLVSSNLVIAADGSARIFANQMEQDDIEKGVENPFTVTRYEDDNERSYKTIPFKLPSDWRHDLNYSVRSKGDRTFDALPANDKGDYCGVMLLKSDDELAKPNVDPVEFRIFLNDVFPQFSPLIDDETAAMVAKKEPSFLPRFRYVGPRLHQGKRTILLGDCAHTVKPYFGMGANSALEDVKVGGRVRR